MEKTKISDSIIYGACISNKPNKKYNIGDVSLTTMMVSQKMRTLWVLEEDFSEVLNYFNNNNDIYLNISKGNRHIKINGYDIIVLNFDNIKDYDLARSDERSIKLYDYYMAECYINNSKDIYVIENDKDDFEEFFNHIENSFNRKSISFNYKK